MSQSYKGTWLCFEFSLNICTASGISGSFQKVVLYYAKYVYIVPLSPKLCSTLEVLSDRCDILLTNVPVFPFYCINI